MRIYLDTCCLMRPQDDRRQPRVALEAEAVLAVVEACCDGAFELYSSEAIMLEINTATSPAKRRFALDLLRHAVKVISLDDEAERRSSELTAAGYGVLDAVHLALCESAAIEYLCTCDDRLLAKAAADVSLGVKVTTPIALLQEIEE